MASTPFASYPTSTATSYGGSQNSRSRSDPTMSSRPDMIWAVLFLLQIWGIVWMALRYGPLIRPLLQQDPTFNQLSRGLINWRIESKGSSPSSLSSSSSAVLFGGGSDLSVTNLAVLVVIIVFTSASLGLLGWSVLLSQATSMMVKATFFLLPALYTLLAAFLYGYVDWPEVGVIVGLFSSMMWIGAALWHTCCWRRYVPFVTSTLGTALSALRPYALVWSIVLWPAVLLALGAWTLVWLAATLGWAAYVYTHPYPCPSGRDHSAAQEEYSSSALCYDVSPGVWVLLALSYYWTWQVLHHGIHVTVAGTVASWWTLASPISSLSTRSPYGLNLSAAEGATSSWAVVGRAALWAWMPHRGLGSVCLGSLLTAVAQTVEYWLRESQRQQRQRIKEEEEGEPWDDEYSPRGAAPALGYQAALPTRSNTPFPQRHRHQRNDEQGISRLWIYIAETILGWLHSFLQYFNAWAFCYVAMYHVPYMTAGRQVMQLFQQRGWTTLISDRMIYRVLQASIWSMATYSSMTSVVLYRMTMWWVLDVYQGTWSWPALDASDVVVGVVAFFVSYIVCEMAVSLVESAIRTVMVCFAENPDALKKHRPDLHLAMRQGWDHTYPGIWHRNTGYKCDL